MMARKLLKNKGFSLSEVMVSAAILVLVTAAFATVAIMMRSLSNVKSRNVAYSIANDRINELQRNPSDYLPKNFVENDVINPDAAVADGTYVVDTTINDRRVGTRDGNDIFQTFTRRVIFYPVESRLDPVTDQTNLVNMVQNNQIEAGADQCRLVRIIVRVTWQDYRQQQTYRIEEEDFIRRTD